MICTPFSHLGRDGLLCVRCQNNPGPERSGLDSFNALPFDPELCRLYPEVSAWIHHYGGTGYRTNMGWIQVVDRLCREAPGGSPTASSQVDAPEPSSPFFCHGYTPSLYDAPCHSLENTRWLEWRASTYLTTYPGGTNGGVITFLAGFQWGFREWPEEGAPRVELLPLIRLDSSAWNAHLPLLRGQYPRHVFQ